MTRVSKQKIDKDLERSLFKQFASLFSSGSQNKNEDLFTSVFSGTERMMFIKRIAIVILLAEGYSTYSIAKTLTVSDSTVRSIQKQAKVGKFDAVIEAVTRKSFDRDEFFRTLDILLRCGLPPRGRGRWNLLRKSLKR